jgi:hypothetical protein
MTGHVFLIKSVTRRHIVDATKSYTAERVQLSGHKPLGSHEYARESSDSKEFKLARAGMRLSIIYEP